MFETETSKAGFMMIVHDCQCLRVDEVKFAFKSIFEMGRKR